MALVVDGIDFPFQEESSFIANRDEHAALPALADISQSLESCV
ncbi:hypothetical protein [Billgrantia saliphila]|nr:hypothetical protein [Halomonas saliphila]